MYLMMICLTLYFLMSCESEHWIIYGYLTKDCKVIKSNVSAYLILGRRKFSKNIPICWASNILSKSSSSSFSQRSPLQTEKNVSFSLKTENLGKNILFWFKSKVYFKTQKCSCDHRECKPKTELITDSTNASISFF